MESSDDNFAWTSASSAKETDDSTSEDNMNDKHNESGSEKSYKKKLHKKLFKTEPEIKNELLNGNDVKHEVESDAAVHISPRKRKRKRERTPSVDSKPTSEYLETVKQEYHNSGDSQDENPKKKKSKRKKEQYDETSDTLIEDKFCAEETIVETRPNRELSTSVDEEPVEKLMKKDKKKKKKKKHDSEEDCSMQEATLNGRTSSPESDTYENNNLQTDSINAIDDSTKHKKLRQGSSKISDRIQFEDGEDLIDACNKAMDNVTVRSSRLKRFLKVNPHLHSLTCKPDSDSFISHDDDIWLLNCPQEIDILALKGSNLSLDNKCKIKIDSQTYVGNIDEEIDKAAILTFEHNKPVIKSFVLNGVVNLRKRIPKAHFVEDNIITNNQADFIPLPNTKCRHPLFGADYKKAMKIPSSVKSRLQNVPSEPPLITKERKKKKKKYDVKSNDMDVVDGVDMVDDSIVPKSEERGRKRRQSERDLDQQPVKKKAKRVKQEAESVQTWDSEKAIEETLFNF